MSKVDVKVLGYSERGIFNSIVFYLRENSEHIAGFIYELGINDGEFFKNCTYTFLNEQSFSDFGDNDWTIIAKKGTEKRVIFIEGKVKTFSGKSFNLCENFDKLKNKESFDGISSNIFVQLYYKNLLVKILSERKEDTGSLNINDLFKKNNSGERKIGKNEIVKKAVEIIESSAKYYYVAILPGNESTADFKKKYDELNKTVLKESPMDAESITCVSWEEIEKFFKGKGAKQVIENFEHNKGQIY
jgi:hypothetical protein